MKIAKESTYLIIYLSIVAVIIVVYYLYGPAL